LFANEKEIDLRAHLSFSHHTDLWFKFNILSVWAGCYHSLAASFSRTEH